MTDLSSSEAAAATSSAGLALRGSSQPLAAMYDTLLLDLDGVVYVGQHAVPGAPAALDAARRLGARLAYVTNNAARPPAVVAAHLTEIGVPAEPDQVVTSAQAAARVVAERVPSGAEVLVVGGDGLVSALLEHGLQPVTKGGETTAAVVQGFAPEVAWPLLAEGAYAVGRGLPWIASNVDRTLPTPRGLAPGNGALVETIRIATTRSPDVVAGKPELPLHREAILRSGARTPLVVGDRLDTDIEGAVRGGSDSLLVLTGVTTPPALVNAPPESRPTYIAQDLDGLLEAHPQPVQVGNGWRCGTWQATCSQGRVTLVPTADEVDDSSAPRDKDSMINALRALCAAAWTQPNPISEDAVAAALNSLRAGNEIERGKDEPNG